MIRTMADLEPDAVLRADIAVVGAGLAGVELTQFLARQGLRVVLLESGGLEFDATTQELYRVDQVGLRMRTPETHGQMTPYLLPMYRGNNRIRQYGGTGNAWTGKWRIFNTWDFEQRPWIPHSGWPLPLSQLLPSHAEIAREYGLLDLDAALHDPAFLDLSASLTPYGLTPHPFYWEKHPTRAGTHFFRELRNAANVDVILNANAVNIELRPSLDAVQAINFRALSGRSGRVEAGAFVLATGGLEVPRLLLASNGQVPSGIGNANGLVGRFFMDHPKRKDRHLVPGPAMRQLLDFVRRQPRPRISHSISLDLETQRVHELPNHAIYFTPEFTGRGDRLVEVRVQLGIEQFPNPNSRVYLGVERDALGMPRLVVDWQLLDTERVALEVLQRELVRAFVASGIGALDLGTNPLTIEEMLDASHHMGTARMAVTPSDGVVDLNCRVFGTENLYIASSAVFPTGHAYSPTYTIVALARRLGHHLVHHVAQTP